MTEELQFNGTLIQDDADNVVFNGTPVTEVQVNGVTRWEKVIAPAGEQFNWTIAQNTGQVTSEYGYSMNITTFFAIYGEMTPRFFTTAGWPNGQLATVIIKTAVDEFTFALHGSTPVEGFPVGSTLTITFNPADNPPAPSLTLGTYPVSTYYQMRASAIDPAWNTWIMANVGNTVVITCLWTP